MADATQALSALTCVGPTTPKPIDPRWLPSIRPTRARRPSDASVDQSEAGQNPATASPARSAGLRSATRLSSGPALVSVLGKDSGRGATSAWPGHPCRRAGRGRPLSLVASPFPRLVASPFPRPTAQRTPGGTRRRCGGGSRAVGKRSGGRRPGAARTGRGRAGRRAGGCTGCARGVYRSRKVGRPPRGRWSPDGR